jgi:H+-translocating NAD(P) transhydrogenase subunit beta
MKTKPKKRHAPYSMSKALFDAMNRSLSHLLGLFNILPKRRSAENPMREDRLTHLLSAIASIKRAHHIVMIPGHGMALSGAQYKLILLCTRLREAGKKVQIAIHPAAGQRPGQMHALLDDTDHLLRETRWIDEALTQADLALVIGACDIVNPALGHVRDFDDRVHPVLTTASTPLVVVCNEDRGPGFSGAVNPLYDRVRTIFLSGDARQTLVALIDSVCPLNSDADFYPPHGNDAMAMRRLPGCDLNSTTYLREAPPNS